jgi:alkyl sulfatase BDS1-like metallo-beta-lactamase superfamily hydrolase
MQQFNYFVPRTGPDAAAGAVINFGKSGMLPVNLPVQDGQRMAVAGVEMQFLTRFGSDTDDCLSVYLPEHKVVLNNILWPFLPNVYTLRGAKFRDPREWRDALKTILDLRPEVLVNTHARAVRGQTAVRDALEHVIDALNLILDQTLRGILRGLGPEELRQFVRLPPALASHPNLAEIYGEISHFGPYLYQHALGWFDGDAANINPLHPKEQAQRLVAAMGGQEAVLGQAAQALEASEFAWAAQLLQYLYRLDPLEPRVRALKAQTLQSMGRLTPAHTTRSWYLSQARALRGEVDIPRLQFASIRTLSLSPPAASMEQYRVRIDPEKAGDAAIRLSLRFSDQNAHHGWHVRRGVAVFLDNPGQRCELAAELEVSYENWLKFFSCRHSLDEFLRTARMLHGTVKEARAFFELFDAYDSQLNHLVPPPRN